MRAADPVHNVELRRDHNGHDAVVFAFPYRADIVDAVRAIPGRRFDWEAKEWWAPRADAVAPYVKGVLERHPALTVAPDVEAWLSRAVTGWIGRVTAGRLDGGGRFVLEPIAGELPESLAAVAEERGGRRWLPFTQAVAEELLEMQGARLDPRALRCASRLQVGLEPAPATLSLTESVGEPRFRLDVNWDPDTIPAFLALPAGEAHGRSLPVDPYLLEPLEHYLRTFERRRRVQRARRAAGPPAGRARRGVEEVRRSRAADAPPLETEAASAASCGRSSAPACATCSRRAAPSSPTSRASARPSRRSPRWRRTTRTRPWSSARPASSSTGGARSSTGCRTGRSPSSRARRATPPTAPTSRPQLRDRPRATASRLALRKPQGAGARRVALRQEPARQAHAGRPASWRRRWQPDALRLALTGTPVMNHPEELIAQLRIIGRLRTSAAARASPGASRARAPRSASTGTCGAAASCGA